MPLTRERGSPRASREGPRNWWRPSPEPMQEGKRIKVGEEKEEQVFLPRLGSQRLTANGPLLPLAHLQIGMRPETFPDQAAALKTGQGI